MLTSHEYPGSPADQTKWLVLNGPSMGRKDSRSYQWGKLFGRRLDFPGTKKISKQNLHLSHNQENTALLSIILILVV